MAPAPILAILTVGLCNSAFFQSQTLDLKSQFLIKVCKILTNFNVFLAIFTNRLDYTLFIAPK